MKLNLKGRLLNHLPSIRRPLNNDGGFQEFVANYGWVFSNSNKSIGDYSLYKQAERNVYVYRSIQVISDTFLINGFNIINPDETNIIEERVRYLTNVFNNPQGYQSEMTYAMFHKQYINSFELTGDAFIEVDYDKITWDERESKVLTGFQFIPPSLLKWFEDTHQWGYRDKPGIRYEPDELIHIYEPGINIRELKYGVSKLEKVRLPILMLCLGLEHNLNLLENDGIDPKAILSFDKDINDESFVRELSRLQALSDARKKGGTLAVKGASFQSGGMNNQDLDFMSLMELARDMIITAYGVQPSKLTIRETASLGSGTGESQDKDFKDMMNAKARIIEGAFNKVLGHNGFREQFLFNEMDIEDKLKRTQIEQNKLNSGVVTVNEVRKEYGLEPVPWGDLPNTLQNNQLTNPSLANNTNVDDGVLKRYKNNLVQADLLNTWRRP